MRRSRRGSAYLMVMGALLLACFGASLVLGDLRGRTVRVKALRRGLLLRTVCDAGLVRAFHELKKGDLVAAAGLGEISGRLDELPYRVVITADGESGTVSLDSSAAVDGLSLHRRAVATHRRDDRRWRWSIRYLP